MRVLAIETSTMLGGVAVVDDRQGLVAEARLNVRTTHSERLMSEIDRTLRLSGLGINDIDVFAASSGPGSFTGLRIGLSTLKGLSYATGKPVVAVPTLEALAWNFPMSTHPVCVLLDARKKEVYAGVFLREAEGFRRLVPEQSVKIRELLAGLGDYGRLIFSGEGALLYRAEISEMLGPRAVFAPPHLMVPMPSGTAYLGMMKALKGQFADPAGLRPFYIRKAEAELKAL